MNIFIGTLPHIAIKFARVFSDHHYSIVTVGGAVRNILLGIPVSDIDFATDATPQQMMEIFPNSIATGIQHGTLTIPFRGQYFEVTTYRTESRYHDHRRPDSVRYITSLQDDLGRRDFTINAIAIDPLTQEIIDPHKGRDDLKKRIIRCVGNASVRFQEDALRMLRAIRFASTLGFDISSDTFNAIKVYHALIGHISKERIWNELHKMMDSDAPHRAFALLCDTMIFKTVMGFSYPSDHYQIIQRLLKESIQYLPNVDTVVYPDMITGMRSAALCALSPSISPAQSVAFSASLVSHLDTIRALYRTLRTPKKHQIFVYTLLSKQHYRFNKPWNDFKIRALLASISYPHAETLLCYLSVLDVVLHHGTHISDIQQCRERLHAFTDATDRYSVSIKTLAINGNDILSLTSRTPGKWLRYILKTLLRHVLQYPHDNTKKILQHKLRHYTICTH